MLKLMTVGYPAHPAAGVRSDSCAGLLACLDALTWVCITVGKTGEVCCDLVGDGDP
jgi:hypothetical protein